MITNTDEFSVRVVFTALLFIHFIHHHEGKMLQGKSPSIYSVNYATQTDEVPLGSQKIIYVHQQCVLKAWLPAGNTENFLCYKLSVALSHSQSPCGSELSFLKWILASVARQGSYVSKGHSTAGDLNVIKMLQLCWLRREARIQSTELQEQFFIHEHEVSPSNQDTLNAFIKWFLCLSCIHIQHGVTIQLILPWFSCPWSWSCYSYLWCQTMPRFCQSCWKYWDSGGIFVVQGYFSSSWVALRFQDKTEDKRSLSAGWGLSSSLQ